MERLILEAVGSDLLQHYYCNLNETTVFPLVLPLVFLLGFSNYTTTSGNEHLWCSLGSLTVRSVYTGLPPHNGPLPFGPTTTSLRIFFVAY